MKHYITCNENCGGCIEFVTQYLQYVLCRYYVSYQLQYFYHSQPEATAARYASKTATYMVIIMGSRVFKRYPNICCRKPRSLSSQFQTLDS